MHIHILCIGKLDKQSPEYELCARYLKRLPWHVTIKELECKQSLTDEPLKTAEAALLLKHVPDKAMIIALDERGKNMSTNALSDRLANWRDDGVTDMCFLIGGAFGHGDIIRNKAHLILSFGALTWPHKMIRPMLIEQLYRIHTLQTGHPYHK